ncbi:DNA-processing protein DprA [Simiduia litorea]|uniref:DNA-processing protein DprA n=1 Tax=Simiduia litorea TaxID=1435348 RepID=UPI0036F1F42F
MQPSERDILIALHHLPGLGPQTWLKLEQLIQSPVDLLDWPKAKLIQGLGENGAQLFCQWRANRQGWLGARLDALARWLEQEKRHVVTILDDLYPPLLKETSGPLLLYVAGDPLVLNLPQIAVVGARKATAAGLKTAHHFSQALASGGYGITSGLALGIDTQAHLGALAGLGKTVAVLGCGLDKIYPARNTALAAEMIGQGGAIISEFALGVQPEPGHFPRRNRIISGLSMATLVIEAALKSGSLITARQALEQNREVFVIPGSIYSEVSAGCHWLIREGATLVDKPEQIAEQLGSQLALFAQPEPAVQSVAALTARQRKILQLIGRERVDFEELLSLSSLSVAALHQALGELEMLGAIASCEQGIERRFT